VSGTDVVRHALLTTGRYSIAKATHAERTCAQQTAHHMRAVGYRVEFDGTEYLIRNRSHRPTSEQFAAARQMAHHAPKNGTSNGAKREPKRSGRKVGAAMLPALGASLTVVLVGFGADGAPVFVLEDSDRRYDVAVTTVTPLPDAD